MLNPRKDRLNYSNILHPPADYHLDFAVGTTYSLDLNALIASAISSGSSVKFDSYLTDDPIFSMNVLQDNMDRIVLFCEKGRIKFPEKPTKLYILLENMVFQVDSPKNGYYSFHPKFWLLRFIDDDGHVLYRIIVLSRNLTFDRSWDISFSMDGHKTRKKTDKNKAVSGFLKYLKGYVSDEIKKDKMDEIIKELNHVHFDLDCNGVFNDFEFIINGIDEKNIKNYPLFSNRWDELLIISPFLNGDVIKGFNNRSSKDSKAALITRPASLGKLKPGNYDNFNIYTLKEEIIEGGSESSHRFPQDIHAKMYMMKKDNRTELYLGSLNASRKALEGNVEFMVRLSVDNNKLDVKDLTEDIISDVTEAADLSKVVGPADGDKNLDWIVKRISALAITAEAISENEHYNVLIDAMDYDEKEFSDFEVKLKPLFSYYMEFSNHMEFEKLKKSELSEFYVLKVSDGSKHVERIIKIPTEGLPEGRQKEAMSIIRSQEDFKKYVAYAIFGQHPVKHFKRPSGESAEKKSDTRTLLPGLYEKMLKAVYETPEKFENLDYLIRNSSDEIIPDGFEELCKPFLEVKNGDYYVNDR